jgi:integrase
MPRVVQQSKEALTKEDIVNILNACPDMKLKTYVLFLAATGARATEALSTRLQDYDFSKGKVFIRGDYTKTKTDRYIFLTRELQAQLKTWIEFKHRPRKISNPKTGKVELRTPTKDENDLLFSTEFSSNKPTLNGLYLTFVISFERTLDRMGDKYARFENAKKRRRLFTLHSFRRRVKSTISDLGYSDFSEWFIGHVGSSYYRKSEKEKYELFKKIEGHLTYLDITSLERQGADVQTRVDALEHENQRLRQYEQRMKKIEKMLDNVADQLGL